MRRLLVAVVVGLGLFAMHGLAAPSAQAAHCGAPPGHVHAAMDHAAPTSPVQATTIALPGAVDQSGGWLACAAILVGLALVASARRMAVGLAAGSERASLPAGRAATGRAPPAVRPEDVGVWRT